MCKSEPTQMKGLAELLTLQRMRVLLDTNILIQGADARCLEQRKAIQDFCKQNEVCICDTVFYEFLRNCSPEKFRRRMRQVESWSRKTGMMPVLPENEKIPRTFESLWILFLSVMRADPKRLIHLNKEDLWIAAAAAGHGIDHILTTDHSGDYPPEAFDDRSFDISMEKSHLVLHLKTFKRNWAREQWKTLMKAGSANIDIRSFFFGH